MGWVKSTERQPQATTGKHHAMDSWNDTSEHRRQRAHRAGSADRWVERTRLYLRSRTADHWLMFLAGLLLGALIA
jgi:hypothetical protein